MRGLKVNTQSFHHPLSGQFNAQLCRFGPIRTSVLPAAYVNADSTTVTNIAASIEAYMVTAYKPLSTTNKFTDGEFNYPGSAIASINWIVRRPTYRRQQVGLDTVTMKMEWSHMKSTGCDYLVFTLHCFLGV